MDELIQWKNNFKVGVDEIDFQHQYFAKLINRLANELDSSLDDEHKYNLFEELLRYASFHFLSEENIMFSSNYSELEKHKELHVELINQLNEKIIYLKMSKLTYQDILAFLCDWFIHHTVEVDKEFGIFLNR